MIGVDTPNLMTGKTISIWLALIVLHQEHRASPPVNIRNRVHRPDRAIRFRMTIFRARVRATHRVRAPRVGDPLQPRPLSDGAGQMIPTRPIRIHLPLSAILTVGSLTTQSAMSAVVPGNHRQHRDMALSLPMNQRGRLSAVGEHPPANGRRGVTKPLPMVSAETMRTQHTHQRPPVGAEMDGLASPASDRRRPCQCQRSMMVLSSRSWPPDC